MKNVLVLQEKERAAKVSKAVAEAEAITKLADAALYKAKTEADANLYSQQRSAEAAEKTYAAQAKGVALLQDAFHGDSNATIQYFMLEKGLYLELAKANAEAIRGLEPKITVWNTGSGDFDAAKPIRDIFQSLPPLLSTINDQTGIQAPSWLADMSKLPTDKHVAAKAAENGTSL
jgi:flotillin